MRPLEACQTKTSPGVIDQVFETSHNQLQHQKKEFQCLQPAKTPDILQHEYRKRPDIRGLLIFCFLIRRQNSEDVSDGQQFVH